MGVPCKLCGQEVHQPGCDVAKTLQANDEVFSAAFGAIKNPGFVKYTVTALKAILDSLKFRQTNFQAAVAMYGTESFGGLVKYTGTLADFHTLRDGITAAIAQKKDVIHAKEIKLDPLEKTGVKDGGLSLFCHFTSGVYTVQFGAQGSVTSATIAEIPHKIVGEAFFKGDDAHPIQLRIYAQDSDGSRFCIKDSDQGPGNAEYKAPKSVGVDFGLGKSTTKVQCATCGNVGGHYPSCLIGVMNEFKVSPNAAVLSSKTGGTICGSCLGEGMDTKGLKCSYCHGIGIEPKETLPEEPKVMLDSFGVPVELAGDPEEPKVMSDPHPATSDADPSDDVDEEPEPAIWLCQKCDGTGYEDAAGTRCYHCQGSGIEPDGLSLFEAAAKAIAIDPPAGKVACPNCKGTGQVHIFVEGQILNYKICVPCGGAGFMSEEEAAAPLKNVLAAAEEEIGPLTVAPAKSAKAPTLEELKKAIENFQKQHVAVDSQGGLDPIDDYLEKKIQEQMGIPEVGDLLKSMCEKFKGFAPKPHIAVTDSGKVILTPEGKKKLQLAEAKPIKMTVSGILLDIPNVTKVDVAATHDLPSGKDIYLIDIDHTEDLDPATVTEKLKPLGLTLAHWSDVVAPSAGGTSHAKFEYHPLYKIVAKVSGPAHELIRTTPDGNTVFMAPDRRIVLVINSDGSVILSPKSTMRFGAQQNHPISRGTAVAFWACVSEYNPLKKQVNELMHELGKACKDSQSWMVRYRLLEKKIADEKAERERPAPYERSEAARARFENVGKNVKPPEPPEKAPE